MEVKFGSEVIPSESLAFILVVDTRVIKVELLVQLPSDFVLSNGL